MPAVTCSECGAQTHTDFASEWVKGLSPARKKGLHSLIAKQRLYLYVCPNCTERIRLGHVGQTSLLESA